LTPITPNARDLKEVYNAGRSQVAWTTLVADLETPVSAYLKLARNKANVFLLESVAGGAIRERYSFIGMNPDMIWRCFGNRAEINRRPAGGDAGFAPCPVSEAEGTIASLRALVAESAIKDMPSTLPPMAAGLIGYMAYDTVRLVERIPAENPDRLGLPEGLFIRPTVIAVFDTVEDTITIATPVRPKAEASADQACSSAFDRLRNAISILEGPLPHDDGAFATHNPEPIGEPAANMTTRDYCAMVAKAKEYILAGDIFQVVLSQRFSVPFALPALALYRSLRRLNPSPFLFLLNFGDFAVVGSSPEILVRVRDGKATIRPIAGTRPRGGTEEEDKALAEDLLNDPKELSEHLMLLDLGRNDVGRVAKIGTVTVTKDHFIEYYSHVMHIGLHRLFRSQWRHGQLHRASHRHCEGRSSACTSRGRDRDGFRAGKRRRGMPKQGSGDHWSGRGRGFPRREPSEVPQLNAKECNSNFGRLNAKFDLGNKAISLLPFLTPNFRYFLDFCF